MKTLILSISLLIAISSCHVKPGPINYGQDGCHFCKMTIVDNQHAAQIVTTKGKSYKYDAIECMMNDYKDWDRPDVRYFLVADYSAPGLLADAKIASYLISPGLPSPMGANLTAFEKKSARDEKYLEHQGKKLDWKGLLNEFERE